MARFTCCWSFAWAILLLPIVCGISLVTVPPPIDPQVNQIIVSEFESAFYEEFREYVRTRQPSADLLKMKEILNQEKLEISLVELPDAVNPHVCLKCRTMSHTFLAYNKTEHADIKRMTAVALDLCDFLSLPQRVAWEGEIHTAAPTVEYILRNTQEIDANRVCSVYFQDQNCAERDLSENYSVNLPTPAAPEKSKAASERSPNAPLVLVHLSDFHFDPYYAVGSHADCGEWVCCRRESSPGQTVHLAGHWGDYFPCDSPWTTVEDIVHRVKKEYPHIDMVYYTGDIVDHFGWATSIEHNSQSIRRMTNYLKEQFNNIPLFPVLGNHEMHPSNSISPSYATGYNVSSQWLFDLLDVEWGPLLSEEGRSTLKQGGHYSMLIRPKLRLIALNNNYCYATNLWLMHSLEYFAPQLQWFRDELSQAEANGEKVHVISHIPSSDQKCFKGFAREYRKIVEEFSDTIVAVFNGHTHEDEFNVYYSAADPSKATGVAFNGGSGTTFAYFNSNFKVYSVDAESFEVLDYDTWHFNLTEANLNPESPPKWQKTYSFKEAYGVADMSPKSMDELTQRLGSDRQLLQTYWERKEKYSDVLLKKGCDHKCLKKNFCDIVTMVHGENAKCEELFKL